MFERLKRLFRRDADLQPVALVLLETTARLLTKAQIAEAVSKAIGGSYLDKDVRRERPDLHRFWVEGYEFTLETRPRPYIPRDREPHSDLTLREVVARHEAAILLDAWAAPPGRTREDGTDLMGRILVEIADETSVGVYCFHTQRINPVDGILTAMLREGRGREAMESATFSMFSGVRSGDSRMVEAIAEARMRWPEFVAAFDRRRSPDAGFGVKAPFRDGEHVEHMWIDVEEVDFEEAKGRLLSRPFALSRPKQGEQVTVSAGEISDWSYQDGEARGGGFTSAVIKEAQDL